MLYESTYNQYFLEHSWGPWKKHLYISRDGESGKYTYKYPKEYYDQYRQNKASKMASLRTKDPRWNNDYRRKYNEALGMTDEEIEKQNDFRYNMEVNNSDVNKVINRSVKAAVDALNFAHDTRVKAEGYLNRFANAVADAWNGAKSPDRTRVQAGKQFVSNLWDSLTNTVTAKKITSSIQNLVKGAGEAVKKTWNDTKTKVSNTKTKLNNKKNEVHDAITDRNISAFEKQKQNRVR